MTMTSHHSLAELTGPTLLAGGVQVRWSAVVAGHGDAPASRPGALRPRPIAFVVTLQSVDEHHALLEAWLETPTGLRNTFRRQPVTCAVTLDEGFVHVDAHLDGQRLVALSFAHPGANDRHERILYARTPLLAEAGLAPGAYDPPTARLLAPEQDAASA